MHKAAERNSFDVLVVSESLATSARTGARARAILSPPTMVVGGALFARPPPESWAGQAGEPPRAAFDGSAKWRRKHWADVGASGGWAARLGGVRRSAFGVQRSGGQAKAPERRLAHEQTSGRFRLPTRRRLFCRRDKTTRRPEGSRLARSLLAAPLLAAGANLN